VQITAIKQQVKRTDRYSVFVDGKYAFSLSEGGLITSGLASGQEFEAKDLARLKREAGLDKAYGNALRYVAMRPRSEWEVAIYLQRKQIDPEAAAQIITRLRGVGLLDDTAFAAAWVANRRLLKNVSKRRLKQELQQKHLASDIIDQALQDDITDERDTLRELVEKKRSLTKYRDNPLKFMQYLARQGFGYDDIKTVLGEYRADSNS
jgi:regulatory protein